MRPLGLAWKNVLGNRFRSLAVCICAALVASLVLAATLIVRGAEESLRANLQRLGADILVLPWGTMTEKIGGVRLMSATIDGWMPRAHVAQIAALDGVSEVSPQLYLGSLKNSAYCTQPEMLVVAYDPATDFTLVGCFLARITATTTTITARMRMISCFMIGPLCKRSMPPRAPALQAEFAGA